MAGKKKNISPNEAFDQTLKNALKKEAQKPSLSADFNSRLAHKLEHEVVSYSIAESPAKIKVDLKEAAFDNAVHASLKKHAREPKLSAAFDAGLREKLETAREPFGSKFFSFLRMRSYIAYGAVGLAAVVLTLVIVFNNQNTPDTVAVTDPETENGSAQTAAHQTHSPSHQQEHENDIVIDPDLAAEMELAEAQSYTGDTAAQRREDYRSNPELAYAIQDNESYMRGQDFYNRNDYQLALNEWKTLEDSDPYNYVLLNNIGLVYEQLNMPEQAIIYYQRSLDVVAQADIQSRVSSLLNAE